jgi:hypothetical protein
LQRIRIGSAALETLFKAAPFRHERHFLRFRRLPGQPNAI